MRVHALRCTGVILSGGQGRRFGGRDKGLLRLQGRPLAGLAAARLAPQVDRIDVSIARHRSRYRALGLQPVMDRAAGFPGPLAGLASAMAQAGTPYLVTLPCDSPDIPADYVRTLWRALRVRQADICVIRDGTGLHPLHALMKIRLRDSLDRYLAGGGRAVFRWVMQQRWTSANLTVGNLNHPVDLRRRTIKRRYARGLQRSGAIRRG